MLGEMDHDEARLLLAREVLGEDGIVVMVRMAQDISPKRLNRLLEALDALAEHAGFALTIDRETAALAWRLGFLFHDQATSWKDQPVIAMSYRIVEKIEALFAVEQMEERTLQRYRGSL
ncbi:MAG: hypothetical protein EOO74_08565 [Myxococcales bacterium]|nr:MAG: hypothetical protein EOO74_08565 [Myxococcales bacterium]